MITIMTIDFMSSAFYTVICILTPEFFILYYFMLVLSENSILLYVILFALHVNTPVIALYLQFIYTYGNFNRGRNSLGYEMAKRFNSKFTHLSPVWYDLKRYALQSLVTYIIEEIEGRRS